MPGPDDPFKTGLNSSPQKKISSSGSRMDFIARGFLVCLMIIGLGFTYGAWQDFKGTHYLISQGFKARARVVGIQDVDLNQKGHRHGLVFEFTDEAGRRIQVDSTHSYYPYFMPYDEEGFLPILYDGAHPSHNHIDTFGRLWGRFLLFAGFGGLLALFGGIGLILTLLPQKAR